MIRSLALAVCVAVPCLTTPAGAADYPSRSIRLVVPFPAGGQGIDMVARTLAQKIQERTGQAVIVENKPGAGTLIGTSLVAKAAPDGYTALVMANSFTINPSLQPNLPYDTRRDFAPVTLLSITPHVLVARPSFPFDTLQAMLEHARAKPDSITYASIGNGTSPHLAGELMKKLSGASLIHAPFKGQAPALTAVIGGQVDLMFGNLPDVLPYIRDGKLKALAISALKRDPELPGVPTMGESGMAEFESNSWYGMVVPSATPAGRIQALNRIVVEVLGQEDVRASLAQRGLQVIASSPAEFGDWMDKEFVKYADLVEASGARID